MPPATPLRSPVLVLAALLVLEGSLCPSVLQATTPPLSDPGGPPETGRDGEDFFETRIRPVLVESCHRCHSRDAKRVRGGLLLDSRAGVLRGGATGPALVPGKPEDSLLVRALRYEEGGDLRMPPGGKLPDAVIADFVKWIAEGGAFPEAPDTARRAGGPATNATHWAFQAIRHPALPPVRDRGWPRNRIDRFVLARLEREGLTPSPDADRRVLARRVYYGLIGLPPTRDEVEAFVLDASPDALERLVDRLLNSPRYGERWARHWLDVARYADAKGYVDAGEPRFPFAFTYRDYVVRAFNDDIPFDRFVLEQLAADQLIETGTAPDNRALAALGFLTVGSRFNFFPHEVIDDRIDVVTRGFMGLTVTCARCHDHKYDPITAADYYALYGVFASSREPPANEYPVLREGRAESSRESEELREELAKATEEYTKRRAQLHRQIQHELRAWIGDYLRYIVQTTPEHRTRSQPELRTERGLIREFSAYGPGAVGRWRRFIRERGDGDRVFGLWNRLMALEKSDIPKRAPAIIRNMSQAGELNPLLRRALEASPPADMADVANLYGEVLEETEKLWRERLENASPPAAFSDPDREELRQVLYGADSPASVSVDEAEDYYLLDEHSDVRAKFANIERVFLKHSGSQPRAMVLVDREHPIEPRIFRRGNAERPGESVPRRVPELLASLRPEPFPATRSGRLELARAIVHPDNPLTARVIVNRVWAWHFGRGLVETPSDFGTRSSPPVHAELLDDLAAWFIESGWSLKKLHRLIVNSRTFCQSSNDRPRARELDPDNRLLWRMNRGRLDFESMRDSMLHVTGRLDARIGGRPVSRAPDDPDGHERTIYLFVDRERLPGLFRVFDFPSPDISAPERPKTTVPQQALFLLNSPFVIARAEELAERVERSAKPGDHSGRIRRLYRAVYARDPDPEETALAERFVRDQEARLEMSGRELLAKKRSTHWRYGFGEYDPERGRLKSFTPLPYFEGSAWQGAAKYPDGELHYLRLDARGGHVGIDQQHAAVRRWIAPRAGVVTISGTLRHGREDCGDGVRARVASTRRGQHGEWAVYKTTVETTVTDVEVDEGDAIDFVVDCRENHSCDEFEWAPVIRYVGGTIASGDADRNKTDTNETDTNNAEQRQADDNDINEWDAARDFGGAAAPREMTPWARLAQILLQSNEFLFVD